MKKKILLSVFLFSLTLGATAQTIIAKAGLNASTVYLRSPYGNESVNTLLGFHLGGTIDIPIYETFSVEGGLLISQKGFKEVYSEEEWRHRPIYLDFPIIGKYKHQVDNTLSVYGTFGTYFGFGVGGTTQRIDTYSGMNSYKRPIPWGSFNDRDINLKTTDAGIILGGGIEFNAFQIGIAHTIGVANISPYARAGYKIANRVFSLSLGYKLYEF